MVAFLKYFKVLAVSLMALTLAGTALAAPITTIVSVTGNSDPDNKNLLGGGSDAYLAVSWMQTFSIQNWAIKVFNLQNSSSSDLLVHFDLLSGAPDSPTGTVLGQDEVTVLGNSTDANVPLSFPSIVLGPGTFFLVGSVKSEDEDGLMEGAWLGGGTANPSTPGTVGSEWLGYSGTNFTEFVPPTDWIGLGYQVNGEIVPEPGTFLLMGAGLVLAGFARRRRRA